jgi:hypothetical protein
MTENADELQAEHIFLRDLRATHRGNIYKLKLQQATFVGHTPIYILNQLEREEQALAAVKDRLASVEHDLQCVSTPENATTVQPNLPSLYSQYCKHLIATYQTLSFQGVLQTAKSIALPLLAVYVNTRLTVGSGDYDTMSPQERRILAQLDGPCDDETRAQLEQELERLDRTRWSRQSARVTLMEVLRAAPASIILGDPGSGKSTLLHYLALVFATHTAPEQLGITESWLPILVPLAVYEHAMNTQRVSLSDFLADYYAQSQEVPGLSPLFHTALAQGHALVLLDGLDEVVDSATRVAIAHRIQTFITRYAPLGNRILITSRIVGYRTAPLAGTLPHYTIFDFGMPEIARFTQQWCRAYEQSLHGPTPEAERTAASEQRRLMEAIRGTAGIERLASNPLLLTILALIHRQGQSLPRRRVELYELYLDTLLERWSRARQQGMVVGTALDTLETIAILGPLALWLQTSKPAGTTQYHELLREATAILARRGAVQAEREAHAWLTGLREHSGLLVERGVDAWGFLHLTFQEYLAGWGLVRMPAEERWTTLRPHLHDPRWHEVIHLTAGILGVIQRDEMAVTQFIQTILHADSRAEPFLHRDLFLAASVLADDVGMMPAVGHALVAQLGDVWWAEVERIRAKDPNGWWGGPGSDRGRVAQMAGKLRATPYLPTLLERIRPAFADPFAPLRDDALTVFGMAQEWETIRPLLSTPLVNIDDGLVYQLLADEAWDLLRTVIEHDAFDSNPSDVCRALVQVHRWDLVDLVIEHSDFHGNGFEDLASFLVEHERWDWIDPLLDRSEVHVRSDMIRVVGNHGFLDKIRWALTDEEPLFREAAVWSFAHAGAIEVIEPCWDDPEPQVRRAVLWSWQQTHQWERVLAGLNDPDSIIRAASLQAIKGTPYAERGLGYLNDPAPSVRLAASDLLDPVTHHDILYRFLQDPDSALRKQAMHKFGAAEMWDTLQPFMNDPDPQVRRSAIHALSVGAPLTYLLPIIDEADHSIRRLVVQAAVRNNAWEVLWTVLDDPDLTIQFTVLAALLTQPGLNADERARIESWFTRWDPLNPYGTSTLHDLATQYERALERLERH